MTFNLRLYINIKTVNKKDLLQEGKKRRPGSVRLNHVKLP